MKDMKSKRKTLLNRIKYLRENATKAELIVYDYLIKKNVKFIFQKGFISGPNYVIVDFYLPKPFKTCIEIDGGYHNTSKQQKRDLNRDDYLMNYRGFKVFHFTNEDIYKDVSVVDPLLIKNKGTWKPGKRKYLQLLKEIKRRGVTKKENHDVNRKDL